MKSRGLVAAILGAVLVLGVPSPASAWYEGSHDCPVADAEACNALPGVGIYRPVVCGTYSWRMIRATMDEIAAASGIRPWGHYYESGRTVRLIMTKRYRRDGSPVLWTWMKAPVAVKAAVVDYLRLPRDPRWPETVYTATNDSWSGHPDYARGCEYAPMHVPIG